MSDLLDAIDALTARLTLVAAETGACPACRRDLLDASEDGGHAEDCELAEVVLHAANIRARSAATLRRPVPNRRASSRKSTKLHPLRSVWMKRAT